MLPAGQALDLQPDEIESIKVWKGEAATQRYGAAGENGVIEIKTKTGPDQRTSTPDAPVHPESEEGTTKIRIRSSEQQQPLFIIDGRVQPKGADAPADLSPNDIESVEVLKGAAAVARFGSDGTDGAVLIQTKAAAKRREKPRRPQSPRQEAEKLRFGPGITIGDPNPLYVIDGAVQPDARAVENLDMDDIERIDVLKNEPARAIYGESIGDRTVIQIHLKKASSPAPPPRQRETTPRPEQPQPAPQPAGLPAPQPMDEVQQLAGTLYPNPTTGQTQVRFQLKAEKQVVLDVFNAAGQRVLSRQVGRLPAGEQLVEFDATNLPTGSYTVTILAGSARWQATFVRP